MKKTSIINIVLFALGCSVVGCFIYFGILTNIFALQGIYYSVVIVLCVALCGGIMYLLTYLLIQDNKDKDTGLNIGAGASNGGNIENLINKTGGHIVKIKQLNDDISDKIVTGELSAIEKIIYKIQMQLKDETISVKRVEQVEEFFDYYMPFIVKILNSYKRIETNGFTGENAAETKKQILAILPVIKKAFEKEFDYMFTDEMLDITTDIKVLESMLSKDGLTDINNII